MLFLAIDTSAVASAALISADGRDVSVAAAFATEDTRSHAEVLAPGVSGLFDDPVAQGPELDGIVVGVGPGPFTGLRSGIALARTLGFAWNVPVHGLMSLAAIAWDVCHGAAGTGGDDFLVATDARRKEVYWARFSAAGHLLAGPHVGPAAELPALAIYGRGAGLYREVLEAGGGNVDDAFERAQPLAASLGCAAAARLAAGFGLSDTTPLYLRESDARVPGPRKRAL
ncbi:MAG: tRNA (adenosine(37)-N6)-threonylcarbamoyltransferase complex dimerization subunit type 1 TsaB [Actinomycetales bacterium]